MRLLTVQTKNYRTLKDIKLSFSKNYCTLSGKNNAGKSAVIGLLSALFVKGTEYPWIPSAPYKFDYKEDKTQWLDDADPVEVTYDLELSRDDDPALIAFIENFVSTKAPKEVVPLTLGYLITDKDELKLSVTFAETAIDEKYTKDIDRKIKDSNLLFLYNSTLRRDELYLHIGARRMFYEFVMSQEERKELDEAGKSVDKRLRRLARQHKEGLNTILGRLSEKYDVEFSQPEKYSARRMPLGINLRDKHVEVPLDHWGSGTQNRTQILMAVLQANRIRTTQSPDDKITPIVVIEEPEAFLHPSAQSEFGRVLRTLSEDFGVQIIVTTHSPYMLNREEPSSNILLSRRIRRGKAYETHIVDTSANGWMAPFSEHLGIAPSEFSSWRPVFSSYKSKVLLVEGDIDKQYFEWMQSGKCDAMPVLAKDISVVAYGGKDTLKNTLLVQFVLSSFDRVYVTYDLDAHEEVKSALTRLGLKETQDFLPLGLKKPGKECVEGLLPDRILASVNGRETDLVMRLGDAKCRRDAKDKLKKLYLQEFAKDTDYAKNELDEFSRAVKTINARFGD
jgi:predicted ATP-dependent endonuclease of OLD family